MTYRLFTLLDAIARLEMRLRAIAKQPDRKRLHNRLTLMRCHARLLLRNDFAKGG